MQLTHHRFNRESGFTLIEMAIVLMIIGVMVASGASLYKQYRIQKDWDQTQDHLADVVQEIENFYTTYGRYPCPASADAAPGAALYGLEKANCAPSAVGTCVNGVCTYASDMVGETIMEGSIPFKKLDLQEREVLDGYSNRFTYAVTTRMTDSETFAQSAGGISIEDGAVPTPNSMVEPAHSAHFVVISHGADKAGARTKSGVLANPCAGLDGENCNGDKLFISKERDADFDDQIHFHVQATPTEWKSDDANEKISLKNTESIIVGANSTDDGTDAEEVTLRKYADNGQDDRGSLKVDNKVYTEELCEEGLENCFQPRRIAGDLAVDGSGNMYEDGTGNGISCYDPNRPAGQEMQYLQGISNNQPDCTDEIELTCPEGQFVSAIVNGAVRCNILLQNCPETPVTTFCGDSRIIPESAPNEYQSVYSGECRYITDYDEAYFAASTAGKTFSEAVSDIDTINATGRDVQPCEADRDTALIRDSYKCEAAGWRTLTPHEKLRPWQNFTNNLNATNGTDSAENHDTGNDTNNTSYYHDCWCREDYRVRQRQCASGQSNDAYIIEKHTCPQTMHEWTEIFRSDEFCGCSAQPVVEDMSCNAYYDQENNTSGTTGLTGRVYLTYNVTCQNDIPVQDTNPTSVDSSACQCANGNGAESRVNCLEHETNRWKNSLNRWENDVAEIHRTPWVCPSSSSGTLPDPGFLDYANTTTEFATQACACDPKAAKLVTQSCPAGQEGSGITYEVPYNCANDDWEDADESTWTEVDNDCHSCSWQSNSGSALNSVALGVEKGSLCQCGAAAEPLCYKVSGSSKYKIWNNCECIVQNN
ncbi:MAG: type II secretion system protein [Alphaproteobacteria bacterium]